MSLRLVLASLVLLWGMIAPCSIPAQEPVRIGVPLALTGPLAVNGDDNRKGILLYLEEIGFQVAGRKVEVKVEDTEGKPDVGLTKIRKLVESDRVHVIVGVVNSAVAYAIRDYVHGQGVPTIITTAGAKDLTLARKSPFIFRVANDNTQENLPLGHYTYTKLGYKRAVVFASDFAAGREMIAAFSKTYTAAGGKFLKQVYTPLGTTDFAPYLTQIKQDEADVVVAMMYGIDGARLMTQYREYGLRKPVVGQGALISNDVIKASGNASLGVITSKQYTDALDTPANRQFVNAFLKEHKTRPDAWSEQAYVGAKAIGEAIKAVGGNIEDTSRFLEALRKVKFQGPAGTVFFDQNQQRVNDVYIRKVEQEGNTLVNKPIDKFPNVSQSWTP